MDGRNPAPLSNHETPLFGGYLPGNRIIPGGFLGWCGIWISSTHPPYDKGKAEPRPSDGSEDLCGSCQGGGKLMGMSRSMQRSRISSSMPTLVNLGSSESDRLRSRVQRLCLQETLQEMAPKHRKRPLSCRMSCNPTL